MTEAERPKLTPADLERCQAEMRSFMTLGPGMHRCEKAAEYVVRERTPGEDGLKGEMSLCSDCLKVWADQMTKKGRSPYDDFDVILITPEFVLAYQKTKDDVHAHVAAGLFDKPAEEVTVEERRVGRAANFGALYGMSDHKLAENVARIVRRPLHDAEEMVRKFKTTKRKKP